SPITWALNWHWTRWKWRSGRVAASTMAWFIIPIAVCSTRRSGTPSGWTRSAPPVRSAAKVTRMTNAAAESLNSLYKKELIDFRGGWENIMDVTIATMEWVAWYNTERIHSYCGNVPPREYEEAFHRSRGTAARAG